jgi:hypothetical protein
MSILNNSLLLGADAAAAGGYQISRSVRFNSADSAYLSRTPGSAGNRKTWTWAGWVKRTRTVAGEEIVFQAGSTSISAGSTRLVFAGNQLDVRIDGNNSGRRLTTAVFRDFSAWFHIVLAVDTTQATAGNRIKVYVNGVEQTAFSTSTNAEQNFDTAANSTQRHVIGVGANSDAGLTDGFLSGYLAECYLLDGIAADPTSLGEFDTNGVWQPIEYTGTFGTNGFHLPFSDNSTAAALGTDTSSNGNTWTVNNLFTRNVRSLPGVRFGSGVLTAPSSADFNLGTGDFTIEYWLNRSTLGTNDSALTNFSQVSSGFLICLHSGVGFNDATLYLNGAVVVQGGTPEANVWNHYAYVRSGTTCTLYKNGISIASATSSAQAGATNVMNIGAYSDGSSAINGAMSNVRIVKGTAVYTSGFTPTAPLTNVTNTVLLCCQSSSSATAAAVSPGTITATGTPTAGTFNDSSPNEDSLVDSPTNGSQVDTGAGGEVVGNYATLNPLKNGMSLSNGNLTATNSASTYSVALGTIGVSSGKWYWEVTATTASGAAIGVGDGNTNTGTYLGVANSFGYTPGGTIYGPGDTQTQSGLSTYTNGDVIGVALDLDLSEVKFYKNNSLAATVTGLSSTAWFPAVSDSTSSGSNPTLDCNFGQRQWAYAAPAGFKALCTTNLPEPTIADGSTVMDVALYTGNGSTQTISGLNFSPDLVWIKARSTSAYNHFLLDTVRGVNNELNSNTTDFEYTRPAPGSLTAFNSDGFDLNTAIGVNASSTTYVAWTWDAGSSTVTNTAGSISSQVRANASAGFSIVTFTGAGSTATIGHGLGVEPHWIIVKNRTGSADNWSVYTKTSGAGNQIYLNLTDAVGAGSVFPSAPTSTVMTIGGGYVGSTIQSVAYCFAPVAGYSAYGSYVGNGSADGPFVYTGHKSRWLMIKRSDSTSNWFLVDTARDTYNVSGLTLFPNASDSEQDLRSSSTPLDILSNGFKLRTSTLIGGTNINISSATYIYAAFAENPFQYARAR